MFGRKAKIRKAVDRALAQVVDEDDRPDYGRIEALAADLRASAYFTLAQELVDDERWGAARDAVERAMALAPDEVELQKLSAVIHSELGDVGAAIAAQTRVVMNAPREVAPALALADSLITSERLDEAVALLRRFSDLRDREVDAKLAEALFVRGASREALEILDEVCERYEAQLREPWSVTDRQGLISRAQHADRLRKDVYAELHGREATIELAAARGRLDARAGVNYRLLGAQLASKSERVAEVLELQDPDATEQRGRASGSKSALGHALVGSAQLRRGDLGAARKSFERSSELDGRCFAAFFGVGAVLDYDKYELHRRAERLPGYRVTPELQHVVSDWGALTEAERRVVWAAVGPFAAVLPRLAARGVKMRVLPIDVRATDIGLFEHVAGRRASDDHRSYDALSGVATMGGAIAKVEELLDIVSDHGWTFAHEFAHLVYFHLDDARAAPFMDLYASACKVGYANTSYALKNDDELFAVSYTEYLKQRYDLPGAPMGDDVGIQKALFRYFAELCT